MCSFTEYRKEVSYVFVCVHKCEYAFQNMAIEVTDWSTFIQTTNSQKYSSSSIVGIFEHVYS